MADTSQISPSVAPENKPGYQTTEFYVTIITSLFAILNSSGLLGGFKVPDDIVMTIAGLVATYVVGRIAKKAVVASAQAQVAAAQVNAQAVVASTPPVKS